jgi:hypothetical protein
MALDGYQGLTQGADVLQGAVVPADRIVLVLVS